MAPDAAAAKDFYRELFGWTIDAVDGAPMEYHVITNAGRMNGGIVPWGKELGDVSPNWGF